MAEYSTTVISIGDVRDAMLYFDYVIPINLGVVILPRGPDAQNALPPAFGSELLPLQFKSDARFIETLLNVNVATSNLLLAEASRRHGMKTRFAEDHEVLRQAGQSYETLINDFGLASLPLDCGSVDTLFQPTQDGDPTVTIASLKLIDATRSSLEQILEFRRDAEARQKLRRFRVFAHDTYQGKSKAYVEDDILKRFSDYEEAIKSWGFETKLGALSFLLNSKPLAGALTGSFISALLGSPTAAIAAAASGIALELGRLTLDLSKQRFQLRKMMRENPVSYVSEMKKKIEPRRH